MDYIYSELPEVVYDPADLMPIDSPNGTIQLNVNNKKRTISAALIKTPGKLRIIDKNNPDTIYEFNGSIDTTLTIPKFDSRLTVEYKLCTQNGIPLDELEVGDGYLEIKTSTGTTYAPLNLEAKEGSIQKITSVKYYYTVDTFSSIPSKGIYPVRLKDLKGNKYLALYSRDKNHADPELIAKVDEDTVYAILDTGLFGMLEFIDGEPTIKELRSELDKKQDVLEFDKPYDKSTNKVVTEQTISELEENVQIQISALTKNIINLNDKTDITNIQVESNSTQTELNRLNLLLHDSDIEKLQASFHNHEITGIEIRDDGRFGEGKLTFVLKTHGTEWLCPADVAPTGPKGERGVGISSITLTRTEGKEKTYTIDFDKNLDGTSIVAPVNFIVKDGADGHTPKLEIKDDYWYIDDVNQGILARGDEGKSAYQVWLDSGNQGTVQDFINSLKGEQGLTGAPGEQGPAGYPVQIVKVYTSVEEMEKDSAERNNGDFVLVNSTKSVLYMYYNTQFLTICDFSSLSLPNDLGIDEKGLLKIKSGNVLLGNGVEFPDKGGHEIVATLVNDNTEVQLQLKDRDGNLLGSPVTIPAGSGTGGGGGGSVGTQRVSITIDDENTPYTTYLVSGQTHPANFRYSFKVYDSDGYIGKVPVTVQYQIAPLSSSSFRTISEFRLDGQYATIDEASWINLDLNSGTTTYTSVAGTTTTIDSFSIKSYIAYDEEYQFRVVASTLDGSSSAQRTRYITTVNYYLVKDVNFTFHTPFVKEDTITVNYGVVGAKIDKTITGQIYKQDTNTGLDIPIEGATYTLNYGTGSVSDTTLSWNIDSSEWTQGVYKIRLDCVANGNLYAAPLMYVIMYSTQDTDNNQYLFGTDFSYTQLVYGDVVNYKYAGYTIGEDTTSRITTKVFGYNQDTDMTTLIETFDDFNMINGEVKQRAINVGISDYYKYIDKNNQFENNKVYDKLYFVISNQDTKVTYEVNFKELVTKYDVNIYQGTESFLTQIVPRGYTNDESNKDSLSTEYKLKGNRIYVPVEMNNFNYVSNGFMTTASGTNYVRISGDARLKIKLPLFRDSYTGYVIESDGENDILTEKPISFADVANSVGRTVEFRFKVSNCIDTSVPIISYMNTKTTKGVTESHGFQVLPTEAHLLHGSPVNYDSLGMPINSDSVALANFCQDEIIRVTFMLDPTMKVGDESKKALKIYINGELARIVSVSDCQFTADQFTSDTTNEVLDWITIGSNSAQIDLYSVTFYQQAISDARVLQNYFADTTYISDRISLYTANDLHSSSTSRAGYDSTKAEDYEPQPVTVNYDFVLDYEKCRDKLPCILVKGDIPTFKGDKKKVGITITKPDPNGGFIEVVRSVDTQIKDGVATYLNDIDVQGTTSAKEYPRYNFKIKLKSWFDSEGNVVTDNSPSFDLETGETIPAPGVEVDKLKFYLTQQDKISLTNNTGVVVPEESTFCWKADMMSPDHANTVNGLWFNDLFPEIPPQQSGVAYHPTVWGFRCLMFQEVTVDNKTMYTFLGDGCLNNDKGNSNTFGLENDTDSGNQTKCQKWEFLDNGLAITEFRSDKFFEQIEVKEEDASGNETITVMDAVVQALESTYPDQGDLEDAKLLPDYSHIQLAYTWVVKRANFWDDAEYKRNKEISIDYNGIEYTNEYDYRKAIFKNEFTQHFNLDHTTSYYIAVQVTGLVDNHAKNMFLTTYDTSEEQVRFIEGAPFDTLNSMIEYLRKNPDTELEDYIDWENSKFCKWYPTAYDLDSCYGVDNKGYRVFPYNADIDSYKYNDPTGDQLINGAESRFWRMFKECFYSEIAERYRDLASTQVYHPDGSSALALSYDNWKYYMIDRNIDTVPPRVTMEDSIFKYVMPWWFGYSKAELAEPTSEKLYLVKSNRKLDDIDFMSKRLDLYSSLYSAGNYSQAATGLLLNSSANVPEGQYIKIKYDQQLTGRVKWNTNAAASPYTKIDEQGYQIFLIPSKEFGGDKESIYLLGQNHITEIRDLYTLQPSKFAQVTAPNLRVLEIGKYDLTTKVPNTLLTSDRFSVSGCDMLEYLDVSYCTNAEFKELNLSKATMLKTVHAEGCNSLTTINFADGGYLKELYLPALSRLRIRNQDKLETVTLESTDNLKRIDIKGNVGKLDIIQLLLDRTSSNGITLLEGLRLEDVTLDIRENPRWKEVIDLLVSDAFIDIRMDTEGNIVTYDPEDSSTWYPVITGELKLDHSKVASLDADLRAEIDLKLTRIIARYPNLRINPPEPDYNLEETAIDADTGKVYYVSSGSTPFAECMWYQVAGVCAAARAGTLKDRWSVEDFDKYGYCDIEKTEQILEDGTKIIRGWWYAPESRYIQTTFNNKKIPFTIYGFNQAESNNGEVSPVQLISTKSIYESTIYSEPEFLGEFKITEALITKDENGADVIQELSTKIVGPEDFSIEGNSRRIHYSKQSIESCSLIIEATRRSYISYLEYGEGNARWWLRNQKELTSSKPMPSTDEVFYLSQSTLGHEGTEIYCFTPEAKVFYWRPSSLNTYSALEIDTRNGNINVYNGSVGSTYANSTRAFEMLEGSRLVIPKLMEGNDGQTITIDVTPTTPSYWNSSLKTYIDNTYYNYLQEEFRNIIRPVTVQITEGGLSTTTSTKQLKIYAPAVGEVHADDQLDPSYLQPFVSEYDPSNSLSYITSTSKRIFGRVTATGSDDRGSYWLRSSAQSVSDGMYVTTDGHIGRMNAESGLGVIVRVNL